MTHLKLVTLVALSALAGVASVAALLVGFVKFALGSADDGLVIMLAGATTYALAGLAFVRAVRR